MAYSEEAMKFNNVTDVLFNTFGEVLDRDTIYSIVDSYYGDLEQAANAIMSITSEENTVSPSIENTQNSSFNTINSGRAITKKAHSKNNNNDATSTCIDAAKSTGITASPQMSYAGVSTSKKIETIPKTLERSHQHFPQLDSSNWTEQIKKIVSYHNEGLRTLIIMRGAPGSGKTYLARQILEITVGAVPQYTHIFSTDDYFMINGHYKFEKFSLNHAHRWNQRRAFEAMDKGVSPVIIDNTNTESWEMKPYAKIGVKNGYYIEIVEPNTPWARNLRQLVIRNTHGVSKENIQKILERIESNITSANIIDRLHLIYPIPMEPPPIRSFPKFVPCSNKKSPPEKSMGSFQEKDFEIQDSKVKVEDKKNNTFSTLNMTCNDPIPVINEIKTNINNNKQIKYTVKEEGDSIKVLVDAENTELNCDETIINEHIDINHTKENDILNNRVENLAISESQNITPPSELIEQGQSKIEVISNIENEVKEKQSHDLQDTSQMHDPFEYVEEEVTAQPSEYYISNSDENSQKPVNIDKFIEEFQNVENEWEHGEAWEDYNTNSEQTTNQLNNSVDATLPRHKRIKKRETLSKLSDDENDWRKRYVPMIPDISNNPSSMSFESEVETKSSETCMEIGDTEINTVKNGCKVLSTVARDINVNYEPNLLEQIPKNRKFDKSSMTHELPLMFGAHRCRNENKHFIQFRNMFKHLKKEDLRDIFDKCCGDVNWAVSIVMDDMSYNQFEYIALDGQSETEDDCDEPCDCTSFYGIIPDVTSTGIEHTVNVPSGSAISTETSSLIKKQKKDSPLSDSSLALKRQIEQNIVIPDQHYSDHFLKIRKMRRGESDGDVSTSQNISTGITMHNPYQSDTLSGHHLDDTNVETEIPKVSGPSTIDAYDLDYNSDDESIFNEVEKTVNINLGHEFLGQLDMLFGRGDMTYSDNIEPRINMPLSMLNELNALWMESLMCQLEAESKIHEELIKQDEEFARELTMEQIRLNTSGKEPEIPNFKEIMNMEYALSLYRKDCEELKQKDRPNDMAAKLTSKKLYGLFPDIPPEDLDEIHMAHHYDFKTTVEVLLETQGKTDITQEENGIDKFIMAQELERQEQVLKAEKQRLLEQKMVELPDKIDMETVNDYRGKAKLHLGNWNRNFGRAKDMVKKNVIVANYYNNLAGLHLIKYEQANSVAAISLLQMHSRNNGRDDTLDLHYLHVNEAEAALEVFLDSHIDNLRSLSGRDKKYLSLFIITGRGLHSRGGPKIKPAAKILLRRRGLDHRELNPGLLSVKICSDDKLSHEVT